MTRTQYHQELEALQADVVRMAETAADAIGASVEALMRQDAARAERIVAADDAIDARHLELEQRCLRLLALQQPMASDLRTIAAIFAIAIDLERLADHAEGISRAVRRLAGEPPLGPLAHVPGMEALVQEMLRDAIAAFTTRDPGLAEAMCRKDDEVDGLRSQIFRELLACMLGDPTTTPRALELLLVAQHLERAADHVTNIGERVIYMVTGEMRELNV